MKPTGPPRGSRLLRMELPSSVEMLPVLHAALDLFLHRVVGMPSLEERVHLPLVEAVVNAMRHGNRDDPGRLVGITLEWHPPELTARVEDEGEPFDPQIPGEAQASLEDHGRGLFLMQRLSDELHVSRGPCGNVVELVWRVPSPGPGTPPAGPQM